MAFARLTEPGYFSIHGTHLTIECEDSSIGHAVHAVLNYFGFSSQGEPPSPPHMQLRLLKRGRSPSMPKGISHVAQIHNVDVWQSSDHIYLCDGDSVVEIHPSSRSGWGVLRSSSWLRPNVLRPESITLIMHSVLLLLQRRVLFPLHAAAVTKRGCGILFVAKSNGGKSTLALSLVREGWMYLSDDSVVLRPRDAYVEALPLRRDFGLDDDAATYFPEIAGHWQPFLTDERKRRVDMKALYPGQAADQAIPNVLIFPRIVPAGASRLTPIGRTDVLINLMQQSSLLALDPDMTTVHLDVLGRLARQAAGYRLEAGRDLRDDRALLSNLIARVMPAPCTPHAVPMTVNA